MNPHLVSYRDGKPDLVYPLADTGTTVGRDAGCLVQVEDARVSKRHAVIRKAGEAWVVEDLGSRNGTRVNGQTVSEVTTIKDGDRLGFGPVELEFTTRAFDDSGFAPGHVIDLSSKAAQRTIHRECPGKSSAS
jgi:pSer/pThr/pTyr-binding forkhead associated (FHA) protein